MNSDVIKLLPDSVANQIAAGEVIQRPASVVKELVENSVDAGAKSIQIIIKDAGRTLIQVIDNGRGMSPTDARMAFERHATSKIGSADDLLTLHSMGFRGEALPSIAAVAQVEMRTMRAGDDIGCRLRISEAKFEGMEPATCVAGTNMMVKNLFFHMPARRKYLKKDSVELSHILHEFERLALVNTDVDFTIVHNDVTLHSLIHGTLKQRITSLFGKAMGAQIVPLATETTIVKISGFIGLPQHARKRGAQQFFFVNGRNMRHPYFHKAVMSCYADLISADVQPSYFIDFEVDPSTIDVNIHPQKHEIKFENEQSIWQILTAAVKQALGKVNAAGAIDFDSPDDIPDIPVFLPDQSVGMPGIQTDTSYDPFSIEEPAVPQTQAAAGDALRISRHVERRAGAPRDWDKLYEAFASRRDEPVEVPSRHIAGRAVVPEAAPSHPLFADEAAEVPSGSLTLRGRYIVSQSRAGMVLIHRHRAHVRVLFDEFMARMAEAPLPSQHLIFPESVTLSPSQSAVLSSVTETVARLGYDVSFLGDNVWAVNAVPSVPGTASPVEALMRIVGEIEDTGDVSGDAFMRPAALALARSAAVTPATEFSDAETEALVAKLYACGQPGITPDGLTIIHTISYDDIQNMFD